jgi:hypothetical protein
MKSFTFGLVILSVFLMVDSVPPQLRQVTGTLDGECVGTRSEKKEFCRTVSKSVCDGPTIYYREECRKAYDDCCSSDGGSGGGSGSDGGSGSGGGGSGGGGSGSGGGGSGSDGGLEWWGILLIVLAVVNGQPGNSYGQPGNVYGQPGNVYGQPENAYGPPGKVYGPPGNVYGQT